MGEEMYFFLRVQTKQTNLRTLLLQLRYVFFLISRAQQA